MGELAKYTHESGLIKANPKNVLLLPCVMLVEKGDLFDTVNRAVAVSFADLNKEVPDTADLTYLINRLTDNILKLYPSIRLPEIEVAFANGIRGVYGKYYGNLSVVNFECFIGAYLDSEERLLLARNKDQLLIEEKIEPTRDNKFDTAGDLVVSLFENYKQSNILGLSARTCYEFLKLLRLLDKISRKGIYSEALEMTLKEKTTEIVLCDNVFKRRELNAALEALKDNITKDMVTIEQHEEIVNTAKFIILKKWFDDLITDKVDIIDLLNSKREFYVNLTGNVE